MGPALSRLAFMTAVSLAIFGACSSSATSTPVVPLPEAAGSSVWSYLQTVAYQDNWDLWPGKGEKFEGGEPHGALHTVYISPIAADSLTEQLGFMPDGAIIIKENYTPDSVLENITIMYKVDGFNPEHNDWFWGMVAATGEVRAEGKIQGCQSCHGARPENDYVLVGDLK